MGQKPGVALAVVLSLSLATTPSSLVRADDSKRACVEATTEGQTLRKEDKLLEAREKLRVCASDPCPVVVKSHCMRWLGELEAQIPGVIVRAKNAAGEDILDADVSLDGKPARLGRPETLDPGEHVVVVRRASGETRDERFLLVDGEKARVLTVQFPASGSSPPEAPPSTRPAHDGAVPLGSWILGGLGLVAFGSFYYFLVQASDDLSTLQRTCAPACTDAQTASGRGHVLIADVSLGVGIAAVGGAIVLALLPRSAASARPAAYRPAIDIRPIAGGAFATVQLRY